ncbi:MAG: type II toxin-antitoxin system PemK/MazF family toxin [Deltaproteobacteria bacterium]|nr:type II toxin-antitoxin system PemK/MazF family toxin [Deltaproteobacteria bacterium]
MSNEPQRGELWWVDWSLGRGSEQQGTRPALVIQTDAANLNPRYPNTIVLAVSTKGKPVPFHIAVKPTVQNGLGELSYIKCEQILTISKRRLTRKIGTLEAEFLQQVEKAITLVLNI